MADAKNNSKRVLIVGCGKIGLRLAEQLSGDYEVFGLRRSLSEHPQIQFIQADVTDALSLKNKLPDHIDYLVYCLTPSARDEAAYRQVYIHGLQNILAEIGSNPIKRLIFVSSTSVYHQDDASWVNEESPTQPTSFSGKTLVEAEGIALASEHPATNVRFSGIYGGNRSQLIEQVRSGKAKLSDITRLTNRIHEDDCVAILTFLINQDNAGQTLASCYLATDSAPVEYNKVIQFIADKLDLSLAVADEAPKRRAGNKYCSNARLLDSGYRLIFPDYKQGYTHMLKP